MTSVDTERTITVTVNGVPREATVPVRRLLSDALRHDLGLTGTHVGCEHGVCGACTVLVDGDPMRSCLMLAVQVDGHSVTTVEGLARDDHQGGQVLHPVQEAFRECHALQCGFCTPGFLMTIAAGLEKRDNAADLTEEEVDDMVGGNLCRCTGYANIKKAVHHANAAMRDAPMELGTEAAITLPSVQGGGPVTTKLFGEPVRRREDARLIIGKGRYLDDIGHTALAAAFVRSPHAHARITDIDVEGCLDVEGLVAIYTYEDLTGPMAEPLPVLIPHPQLHRAAHRLPAGQRHRPPRRRADRHGHRHRPVHRRGRRRADPGQLRGAAGRRRGRRRAGRDGDRARRRPGQRGRPAPPGDRRRRGRVLAASPHTLEFTQYIERSACMPMEGKGVHAKWDADDSSLRVYTSTQASTSVRAAIAAKLELSLDKVEVIAPDVGGGFGVKIVHPWPEELLVPMAAIALQTEVKWIEDRREHFISSAHERQQRQEIRVGFDDEGRITALDVHIWHDNGAYTPYGIIVPIVTATQLVGPYVIPTYRVIVESGLHEHRHRDAVPRRRAAAGLLRDGTDDGPHRRRAGPRPVRRPRAEPDPARPVPLRPPPDVPGRPAGHLRLGRLPGADGQAARRSSAGPTLRGSGTRPPSAARCSASAWPCTWRAPAPARTRAGTCRCSAAARCWSRPD